MFASFHSPAGFSLDGFHVLYDREEGTFLSRALLVLDKVGASQQYEQSGPPGLQVAFDTVREGILEIYDV